MAVPYTFATATSSIPLSQLDSNFSTPITLGNTSIQLGNTVTTLNNMTLANVTVSSVASTFPNNYLANSTATLGNSTITLGGTTSSVGNLTLVNATISSGTYSVTDATVSGNLTLSGGTANGVAYLNGSKVLTTGSALTFDGTNFSTTGSSTATAFIPSGSSAPTNGMYLGSANNLTWSINSTRTMDLTSTGLGIGTSSPGSLTAGGNNLVVGGGSGNTGMSIYSGTTGVGAIYFADGTTGADAYRGWFEYKHNTNNFSIGTNGSERAVLDSSGNLGLGVTPSAWNSGYKVMQIGSTASVFEGSGGQTFVGQNVYLNASDVTTYLTTDYATFYRQLNGAHSWHTAASGTAGAAITFTQAMTLDAGGKLGIGITSPVAQLHSSAADAGNYQLGVSGTTKGFRVITNSTTTKIQGVDNTLSTSYQPLTLGGSYLSFETNGTTEAARIDSSGNFLIGTAAIATNATDGFLYIPTCAGTPTGTPTAKTGLAPMVIDSTNNKMYIYSGGAWRALN